MELFFGGLVRGGEIEAQKISKIFHKKVRRDEYNESRSRR